MILSRTTIKLIQTFRYFCSATENVKEIKIPMPWGHVAGKLWNPSTEKQPVLTLHGWQDNCATFDRLIPLLNPKFSFLAIDLPGHGLSSKIPAGFFYHNMNYVILIEQIANYYKWAHVALMGHSLGAITNFSYAMVFPDKVKCLINIDGLKPVHKYKNAPRMKLGIREFLKYDQLLQSDKEPPAYPMEVLVKKLAENQSVKEEYAEILLKRNTAPSKSDPGKFTILRDPRLKARLILNWPQDDMLEAVEKMNTPMLLIKYSESGFYGDQKNFEEILNLLRKKSTDLQYEVVEGKHHGHLNEPERISGMINNFLNKYA